MNIDDFVIKEKKKWISVEIPEEMWEALCKHTERVSLGNEYFIRELIHKELKLNKKRVG